MLEDVLGKIGLEWNLDTEVMEEIEQIVCSFYGFPKLVEINDLRYFLLKKKCLGSNKIDPKKNIDMGTLPPCSNTLNNVCRCSKSRRAWVEIPGQSYGASMD